MNSVSDAPSTAPAVRLTGMCKRFGAVQANDDVNLRVAAGTVHGIVGENGAGKSTLMSVLYGFHAADSGRIEVFGKPAQIRNPHEAIGLGIGMVHQHFMLVDTLTALENVLLGAESHALLHLLGLFGFLGLLRLLGVMRVIRRTLWPSPVRRP